MIQCSARGFSWKPVTRPSAVELATPNCSSGRTTVIVASGTVLGVERERREVDVGEAVGVGRQNAGRRRVLAQPLMRPPVGVSSPVSTQRTVTPAGQSDSAANASIISLL